MYTSTVRLDEDRGYTIFSYGNGAAYGIVRESDTASAWIQGEMDTNTFRLDYEALLERECVLTTETFCAQLSNLCDPYLDT